MGVFTLESRISPLLALDTVVLNSAQFFFRDKDVAAAVADKERVVSKQAREPSVARIIASSDMRRSCGIDCRAGGSVTSMTPGSTT
jgi:hypothetical protein